MSSSLQATGQTPSTFSTADWGSGMSASCMMGPIILWHGQLMAVNALQYH